MKINLKKLGEQAIESTTDSIKMRLSEDASSMVFQLNGFSTLYQERI